LIIVKVRERGTIRRTSGGQSVKECHFDSVQRAAGELRRFLQNLMNLGTSAGSRVEKVACSIRRYSAVENCPERVAA